MALAVVAVLPAGAAAYGASRETYTSSEGGYVAGRRGVTTYGGTSTVRSKDPFGGLIAGAAVGGLIGALGVSQIEYTTRNQEEAAKSILQTNTIDPLRAVAGQLMLKNCCDFAAQPNDVIRFEVTANGKTSVFEFERNSLSP